MTGNTTQNADDVVILAGARTPQGKMLGQLASMTSVDLGAHAVRAAVERAGIQPEDVGRVAAEHAIVLTELRAAGGGLEDLFFELTAETQREQDSSITEGANS